MVFETVFPSVLRMCLGTASLLLRSTPYSQDSHTKVLSRCDTMFMFNADSPIPKVNLRN